MPYLIDGYNLLFSYLGTPPSRKLSKALERARNRLLEKVRMGHGGDLTQVRVIFDASNAPPRIPAEVDYHGIHVTFAVHEQRADDLIERLIRGASAPRQLTVVTDDHHIQNAARRRHCTVMECANYLERLDRLPKKPQRDQPSSPNKPSGVTAEETKHWLNAFADLQNDPDLKELSDPHGYGEDFTLPEE